MKILKSKKGMTLIELIVGMLLFAIVAAAASAMLVPMLKIYTKANDLAECNTLLDNVANQIIGDLLESTKEPEWDNDKPSITVTIDNPGDVIYTIGDNTVPANDGVLLKNGNPVLKKNFYRGKSVSFICTREGAADKAYRLTVIITSDRGGEMIQRDYAVRPLVLNQYEEFRIKDNTKPTEPETEPPKYTYTLTGYLIDKYTTEQLIKNYTKGTYRIVEKYSAKANLLYGPISYAILLSEVDEVPRYFSKDVPGYKQQETAYVIPSPESGSSDVSIFYEPVHINVITQSKCANTVIEEITLSVLYGTTLDIVAEDTITYDGYQYRVRTKTARIEVTGSEIAEAGTITYVFDYYNDASPFPPYSTDWTATVDGDLAETGYYDAIARAFTEFFLEGWTLEQHRIQGQPGDVGYILFTYNGTKYGIVGACASSGLPGNGSINSVSITALDEATIAYLTDADSGFANGGNTPTVTAALLGYILRDKAGVSYTSASDLELTFDTSTGVCYLIKITFKLDGKTIIISYDN